MNGRTFKCFGRHIEMRAYIPNCKVGELNGVAQSVLDEIANTLGRIPADTDLQIASNRAGLHLAHLHSISDSQGKYSQEFADTVQKLKDAGWNEAKGN